VLFDFPSLFHIALSHVREAVNMTEPIVHHASALWEGDIQHGFGTVALACKRVEVPYRLVSRLDEEQPGSSPEEFIAGASAACLCMALAEQLRTEGHSPVHIETAARIYLADVNDELTIREIALDVEAEVPDISETDLQQSAVVAQRKCPILKALSSVEVAVFTHLLSGQHIE
jgi:osmotically inducible protein OsmC